MQKAADEEVAQQMLSAVQKEPGALAMWEHVAGVELKPDYESLLSAAPKFPSVWLLPVE